MPGTDLRKIQSCTQTQVQANCDTIQGCTRKSCTHVATWFICPDGLKINENAGSVLWEVNSAIIRRRGVPVR